MSNVGELDVRMLPKHLAFLLVTLTLSVVIVSMPANASPTNRGKAYPTANVTTGAITVTTPAYAYDKNNGTRADVQWATKDGTFNLTSFTPNWGVGATPTTITQPIDLKMTWEVVPSSKGSYRIVYRVSPSFTETVLVNWQSSAVAKTTLVCPAIAEPNDGVWDWTDVSNLIVSFEINGAGGASDGHVYAYEVWAEAISPDTKVSVDPPEIIDDTKTPGSLVTFQIKVTEVYDLAGVEFRLRWNPNVLSYNTSTYGPFLPLPLVTWYWENGINDTEPSVNKEYMWISFTLNFPIPTESGRSGTGIVYDITFKVAGTGSTDLILYGVEIGDSIARPIAKTLEHGWFSNAAVPEFPLGLAMEIALGVSIVAIWWKRKRRVTRKNTHEATPLTFSPTNQ